MVRLRLSPACQERLRDINDLLPSAIAYAGPLGREELLSVSDWCRGSSGRPVLLKNGFSQFAALTPVGPLERGTGPDQYRLAALLQDAELDFETAPPAERVRGTLSRLLMQLIVSQPIELDHRLASIRSAQDAEQYAQMISSRRSSAPANSYQIAHERVLSNSDEQRERREAKKHISAMINVVASMMAVATAAWWVSGGLGEGPQALGIRVFFTLSCCFFIGGAEAWLYYRFFSRLNMTSLVKHHRRRRGSRLQRPVAIRAPSAKRHERLYLRQRAIANRLKKAPDIVASGSESKKSQ